MKFVYLSLSTLNIFLIPIHYDCSQLPRSCLKLNSDFTLIEIYKGFVLIALFNFQDTIFVTLKLSLSATFILYHIQIGLSSTFLEFFEKLFLNIFCRFSATLILYHIFLKLSSIFLKKFLISSFRCVLLLNSRLTATLILYHTFFCLSSSFFQKTFKFFLLPKYVYSLHLLHFSSPSSESFIIIS